MKKFLLTTLILVCAIPAWAADNTHYLNLSWWQRYDDDVLVENLQEVFRSNHDLKIASIKVKENEKIVRLALSQELPQLSFDGTLQRTFASANTQFGDLVIPNYKQSQFLLPLTMTYEVDIWGENHLRTKSYKKQLEMAKQDERSIYIALTSSFAADYFNLVKLDKLIDIQTKLVAKQEKIVAAIKMKYQYGLCNINNVISEEKVLTVYREELNSYRQKQDVIKNQMVVYLSDRDKSEIKRVSYDKLNLMNKLPSEINSVVVQNRPDVQRAERNLERMGYDIKVARRDFLPKFIIFGQAGFNAYQTSKIFSHPSGLASAGIMPSLDIFDGGRKWAMLKLKKHQYDEAIQQYEKAVMIGFQEINDSLMTVKTEYANYDVIARRVQLDLEEARLLTDKKNIGAASNLDILYEDEKLLTAEKAVVSNKINCLISSISLYKATGGKDLYKIEEL